MVAGEPNFFSAVKVAQAALADHLERDAPRPNFEDSLQILEYLQVDAGLLRPYGPDYPLVEPRELTPPFDAPLIEYKGLPAFSLLVLDRRLSYQDEGFQYDQFLCEGSPADPSRAAANRQSVRERLPRNLLPEVDELMGRRAMSHLKGYRDLLPYLAQMDRGHVLARNATGQMFLAGIFASFPSDLDGEIKRFGRQIGKFQSGDNDIYAQNRLFVYRFIMEQTGFPISGERHTSAALFARRLMRRKERFCIRVLGASDRTLTTLTSLGATTRLPRVEKLALVAADHLASDQLDRLRDEGYLVDPERMVVLLKVSYAQHSYHADNVLEDRALSVMGQEVIHPLTGQSLSGLDLLGLGQDRLAVLTDIVRGEFHGSLVYQGRERVQYTSHTRNRLKFLAAWLRKHRHVLADYSPDNFDRVNRVVFSYLEDQALESEFAKHAENHEEVKEVMADLRVAHRLRLLEKLVKKRRDHQGVRLQHVQILVILAHFLSEEAGHLCARHPDGLRKLLNICQRSLDNPYLKRRYLGKEPESAMDFQVMGEYTRLSKLVAQVDAHLECA